MPCAPRAAKVRAQSKVGGPEASDPLVLARLRVDIIVADAMAEAWQAAIELPRSLINGAADASKTISRFEDAKNETARQAQS